MTNIRYADVKNIHVVFFEGCTVCGGKNFNAHLIFVIFFTQAKFLENKIYTEKRINYDKLHSKLPILGRRLRSSTWCLCIEMNWNQICPHAAQTLVPEKINGWKFSPNRVKGNSPKMFAIKLGSLGEGVKQTGIFTPSPNDVCEWTNLDCPVNNEC